jgi:hypothetical protein
MNRETVFQTAELVFYMKKACNYLIFLSFAAGTPRSVPQGAGL